MNKITTPDGEAIPDEDAASFHALLSEATGLLLDPQRDSVVLERPSYRSRNTVGYLILCEINRHRVVGLKRCMDEAEF